MSLRLRKIAFWLPALALAVFVSACSSERTTTAASREGAADTSQRGPRSTAAPRKVRVTRAREETVARAVAVSGTLAAEEQVVLAMKVPGRLSEISVDLGSPVRRGQAIAKLDTTDYRLRMEQAQTALQQARARLGLPPEGKDDHIDPEKTSLVRQARAVLQEAKLNSDRMSALWEQKIVSRAQLDAAATSLQVAEGRYQDAQEEVRNRQAILAQRRSELEIARQQLADTILHVPLDAMVRERHASMGEYLAAGAPVVTLVKIHPLRLRLAVPEREAGGIRTGQFVRVRVEGSQSEHSGRVARLSPSISEGNRTLMVEAEVPNAGGQLRPGSFAKAEILTAALKPSIFVPASSVVTFAGIEKVISVKNDKAVEKRVQTGRHDGDRIEISSGLAAGEPVVIEPGNLISGDPVTVIWEENAKAR
ncbi:MAG TPA: efflux RND transporter periplasmic adaptor subunit [Acidobacteriota bacterium]